MYSPTMMHEMGKIRQQDILREAKQDRLVKLAASGRPSLAAPFLKSIQTWLAELIDRQPQAPVPQPAACSG